MECILRKIRYIEKAETACKHFQEQGHNFNKHAKFIIIDKLVHLHGSKEALREMLLVRENFWIQKLKTLALFGLNQELSK